MTHPAPTAAPEALPRPLRGDGAGGCPRHPRRVRIHGAPWLSAPLLTALLLTSPATAQVIPTGVPAADILLSQAIADQRLFLTCSALEPDTHSFLLQAWERDVAKSIDLLTAAKVAPEAIAAFTTAAAPETLLPAPDTTFEDLSKFCATDPKWLTRAMRLDTVRLSQDLPKVLP